MVRLGLAAATHRQRAGQLPPTWHQSLLTADPLLTRRSLSSGGCCGRRGVGWRLVCQYNKLFANYNVSASYVLGVLIIMLPAEQQQRPLPQRQRSQDNNCFYNNYAAVVASPLKVRRYEQEIGENRAAMLLYSALRKILRPKPP